MNRWYGISGRAVPYFLPPDTPACNSFLTLTSCSSTLYFSNTRSSLSAGWMSYDEHSLYVYCGFLCDRIVFFNQLWKTDQVNGRCFSLTGREITEDTCFDSHTSGSSGPLWPSDDISINDFKDSVPFIDCTFVCLGVLGGANIHDTNVTNAFPIKKEHGSCWRK